MAEKRHVYTAEENQWLRENYGRLSWEEMTDRLEVSKASLIEHCYRMGIKSNRYFSPEEIKFIEDNFGKLTSRQIAKRLNRSEDSIKTKIYKLNLGKFPDNSDSIHLAEVARLVNRDKETIKKTWVRRGLRIFKKGKYSMISEKSLTDVMKKNPDLWNATECDELFFNKFDWFRQKRAKDRKQMCDERWKGYTA